MAEIETQPRPRPSKAVRRLVLWLLPLLTASVLLLGWQRADDQASLERARELLLAGEAELAVQQLEPLYASSWVGPEAELGLKIARALGEIEVQVEVDVEVDDKVPSEHRAPSSKAFPLPLMIRAAFERGNFEGALRLTELAEELGRPTVPQLTAAALIESGRAVTAELPAAPPVESLLLTQLRQHLDAPTLAVEEGAGPRIFDRFGRLLGHVQRGEQGAELVPDASVPAELLPRTLATLAESHADAPSLRSSLDLELAEAAYSSFGRFRGSIVLLDPYSGEILAAVSDRRTYREGGTAAFEQYREPASISKLITTAAYLRQGRDPDRRLGRMSCRGHESYSGERLYCPVIAGPLRGLDRAMAVSCNVAFANLAVEIGRPRLLEELRRFGFDRDLGAFPGGRILEPLGDDRQLADLAIGLDHTELTPLHAATVAAVIGNGGYLVEPSLLLSTDGRLGLHPEPIAKAPRQRILEPEALEPLVGSMRAVVERGTAMRIRTPGFPVAMKTGTASHPRHGFHVNYIGFGPLPGVRLAFAVRITHRGTSRHVRGAAVEVTARLLRKLRTISRQRGWQSGDVDRLDPWKDPNPVQLARIQRLHPDGEALAGDSRAEQARPGEIGAGRTAR